MGTTNTGKGIFLAEIYLVVSKEKGRLFEPEIAINENLAKLKWMNRLVSFGNRLAGSLTVPKQKEIYEESTFLLRIRLVDVTDEYEDIEYDYDKRVNIKPFMAKCQEIGSALFEDLSKVSEPTFMFPNGLRMYKLTYDKFLPPEEQRKQIMMQFADEWIRSPMALFNLKTPRELSFLGEEGKEKVREALEYQISRHPDFPVDYVKKELML